jgi:hypothetical protein
MYIVRFIANSSNVEAYIRTFEPGIIACASTLDAVRTEPYYVHSLTIVWDKKLRTHKFLNFDYRLKPAETNL